MRNIKLSIKILIVDDSSLVRKQVAECFSASEYQITEAENGLLGIEKLRVEKDFTLMICDVNMPVMGGIELLKIAFEEKVAPNMHILMLTTEVDPTLKESAKTYGVRGWVTKPFNPKALQLVVQKILAKK
jgi:two-component system chemotaxis response regulator CheY